MNLKPLANPSIIVVAASYGFLLRLAAFAGAFGIPLRVMLTLSLWRYGYAVLRDFARGKRDVPPPGIETMSPFDDLRLALHFVFYYLLMYLLATTPLLEPWPVANALRWVALLLVLAAFPASAAMMGISGNLGAAITPRTIATVIGVMGNRYWRLLGVCAGVALVAALAVAVLERGILLSVLTGCISAWLFLALFVLIGLAIGECRAEFDLPGEIETREERQQRQREHDWQMTLDRAYASIRGGLVAQGYRTIKELLASEQDSLEIYQWTFNRMLSWESQSHALELAPRFVERLIELGREHTALELVEQCRSLSAQFSLRTESTAALVAFARSIGRHRIADDLAARRSANLG